MMTPRHTWWLSFAGAEGHRGVVLVDDVEELANVIRLTHAVGVNPGGEINTAKLPAAMVEVYAAAGQRDAFFALPRLQLLTRAELEAAGLQVEKMP